MTPMTKLLGLGIVAGIALGAPARAFAECGGSQPATMFGSHVRGCRDDFPVASFLAVVGGASTINNNGISAICQDQDGTDGAGLPCASTAGGLGDGRVYVQFDWANRSPGGLAPLGCPNPLGLPGVGRNFIQIVCNDLYGASAIVTTGYDSLAGGYNFDLASRLDPGSGEAFLTLPPRGLLNLVSISTVGPPTTACFGEPAPIPVFSDCDADSLAAQSGIACPDPTPSVGWGADLYVTTSALPPADLRVAAWTLAPTTPGPSGSRCVTVGRDAWVGATAVVGGQDTGAIAGYMRVPTPTVTADVVRINSAAFVRGRIEVSFSTVNESRIVGFNVYAGNAARLNAGLIPAIGTGSNAYYFAIGRGAARSNRTVTVEAVLSDGTVARTAPAALE